MSFDEKAIYDRIADVAQTEMDLAEAVARDVAFHMTDWLNELDAFSRFCQSPGALSSDELSNLLMDFLVHVPNHVAAAGKLYTGFPVTDIFKVSSTSQEER
ncbi:hypothetical protein BH11PSE11_BH11PSE11_32420 [soil metagenome]